MEIKLKQIIINTICRYPTYNSFLLFQYIKYIYSADKKKSLNKYIVNKYKLLFVPFVSI